MACRARHRGNWLPEDAGVSRTFRSLSSGVSVLLFAQSILEYGQVSSGSSMFERIQTFGSNAWDGLRNVDQRTWLIIGGVLLVLMFLTRRSGRR